MFSDVLGVCARDSNIDRSFLELHNVRCNRYIHTYNQKKVAKHIQCIDNRRRSTLVSPPRLAPNEEFEIQIILNGEPHWKTRPVTFN